MSFICTLRTIRIEQIYLLEYMYQGGKIFKLEVVAKIKTRSTKEREISRWLILRKVSLKSNNHSFETPLAWEFHLQTKC